MARASEVSLLVSRAALDVIEVCPYMRYWTEQFPPEKTAALLFLNSSFLKCFPLSSTIYALETLLMQILWAHPMLLS